MRRLFILPLGLALLCGCAGTDYRVAEATNAKANQRAQRYCGLQQAAARFNGIEQSGGRDVQVYRCVDPRDAMPLPP